ncbi:MAG: 5-oxoprolinase subunit PxpA [Deltaproteobacteria bacterium]|nr:5-oxoprolinase subunit PxpA [Deltaproteobacteria bacterium]
MSIDLNCDMGESFGAYRIGMDEEVIRYITSANVACGWHASDPMVMDRTVRMAADYGVGVGAHPGYPDLLGFGRRNMECTGEEIRNYVIYQIGALQAFCAAHGVRLHHVKPHGSLYNTAVENETVARGIAEAIVSVDPELIFVVLAGARGELVGRIGRELGLRVAYEAFPDRAYTPVGTLMPRKEAGAVIRDPDAVAERALRMASEGVVVASDGSVIPLKPQTLCVHGDTPLAVDLVRRIREVLENKGIDLRPIE